MTSRDGSSYDVGVAVANSYQLELEEVGRAIRGEAHQLLGRADALGQSRAVAALLASTESRTTVALAP